MQGRVPSASPHALRSACASLAGVSRENRRRAPRTACNTLRASNDVVGRPRSGPPSLASCCSLSLPSATMDA
eukprot:1121701-Pleurochrysis_carterae.AAC.1